jgi:hypothetical protein
VEYTALGVKLAFCASYPELILHCPGATHMICARFAQGLASTDSKVGRRELEAHDLPADDPRSFTGPRC